LNTDKPKYIINHNRLYIDKYNKHGNKYVILKFIYHLSIQLIHFVFL